MDEQKLTELLPDLRRIGWSVWDPIGLKDNAKDGDSSRTEYDRYLRKVALMITNGEDDERCAGYLVTIETETMSLPTEPDTHLRAQATVQAIRSGLADWANEALKS